MKVKPCDDRPILSPCDLENFNFQVDPYIGCGHYCHYCYVLKEAETDWRREIMFHRDIEQRLAAELSAIPPQTIYMGWHTDPYQQCEAEHRQTRKVLKLLAQEGFSASILTKSDLVLRDLDLLTAMPAAGVSISVAFKDEQVRQLFEADTKRTSERIAALGNIKAAGIRTSTLICPVIPYICEVEALIDDLAQTADKIWVYGLSILDRSEPSWQNVEKILMDQFSDVKEAIETAVFSKNHQYWQELRQDLLLLQEKQGLNLSIHV